MTFTSEAIKEYIMMDEGVGMSAWNIII